MAFIRPCADLRNNYNEISRICHETKEPLYITKNGTNDLVVLSDVAYENLKKNLEETENERIDRHLSKILEKPSIANNFHRKVYQTLSTLSYFPERYQKIYGNKSIGKIPIDNYIILYTVNLNTRSSFHITYFPQ